MLNALHRRVNEQIDNWTSSAGAQADTLAYEGMVDRAYKECDTDQGCYFEDQGCGFECIDGLFGQ